MYTDTSMAPEQTQDPNGETFNLAAKRPKGNNVFVSKNLPPTAQEKLNAKVHLQNSLLSMITGIHSSFALN